MNRSHQRVHISHGKKNLKRRKTANHYHSRQITLSSTIKKTMKKTQTRKWRRRLNRAAWEDNE